MKKLITVLLVMALLVVSANFALAKDKKVKNEPSVQQEQTIVDYLTPMNALVSEYYKTVAQIKQLENQIENLERQLERLDAVIKYQQNIEHKIEQDKQPKVK